MKCWTRHDERDRSQWRDLRRVRGASCRRSRQSSKGSRPHRLDPVVLHATRIRRRADRSAHHRNQSRISRRANEPAPPELQRALARIFFRVTSRRRSSSLRAATTKSSCASMARCFSRGTCAKGCGPLGRRVTLEAGAHEIAVDYQQFGGGMALNIQRALEGQQPAPFSPDRAVFAKRSSRGRFCCCDAARSYGGSRRT